MTAGKRPWFLMVVESILFWGAVIVLVVAGVRRVFPRVCSDVSWQEQTADLLAQRLARGEINESEYHRRLEGAPRTVLNAGHHLTRKLNPEPVAIAEICQPAFPAYLALQGFEGCQQGVWA